MTVFLFLLKLDFYANTDCSIMLPDKYMSTWKSSLRWECGFPFLSGVVVGGGGEGSAIYLLLKWPYSWMTQVFPLKVYIHPSSIPYGPQLGPSWAKLGPIWECWLGRVIPSVQAWDENISEFPCFWWLWGRGHHHQHHPTKQRTELVTLTTETFSSQRAHFPGGN